MIQLKLVDDAAVEINLSGGGCILLDGYYPETTNGPEHVSESISVRINGDRATIQAKLADINRMLVYAADNRSGPIGAWLTCALTETGAVWRSKVYGGLVEYDGKLDHYLNNEQLLVALIIERDGYWEGAEVQIPLSNGNGTNNTSGLNVYNCSDGSGSSPNKRHNYVEIAAAAVTGDLPAPMRLEMTNLYNSADRLRTVWIGHNVRSTPATFQHIIEGESASFGGSDVSGATYSGGYARTFTWAGDTQVNIARWTLDTTYLSRANKRWFKILARFSSLATTGIRVQCKLTWPTAWPTGEMASCGEVLLGATTTVVIGELQIPPWLFSSNDLNEMDLSLFAQKTGGSSVSIDFLQITPVDSYRELTPRGFNLAYTERLADDNMTREVWADGMATTGKTGHFTGVGGQLVLSPGKLQRIYLLQAGDTGDNVIDRLLSVKAYYRPRRRGI